MTEQRQSAGGTGLPQRPGARDGVTGLQSGQRGVDPVGRWLVRQGVLSMRALFEIEARVERSEARLSDAFRLALDVSDSDIASAEAAAHRTRVIDPREIPPDPALVSRLGAETCARHGLLPWRRSGGVTVVLSARPEEARRFTALLTETFGPFSLAVTTEAALNRALETIASRALITRAETLVPDPLSCRGWRAGLAQAVSLLALAVLGLGFAFAPVSTFAVLTFWAIITLILTSCLKAFSLVHFLVNGPPRRLPPAAHLLRNPVVSVLVPLYRERAIAAHLLERLRKIDYPRELLDICLVLEADDRVTRATISATDLPPWMRTITVPRGTLKTKPRALNYALSFTRGSIIGIWDAEDAPEPDQIRRVVSRFATAPGDVACLQGVLDYYNATTNWMSRCFTLEYATWFRVLLPGLQRLGFVIPLGGTTLFMRRQVIEELGGWDAHNVTEDADLGIRLARYGYRTELVQTVTEEEANCRAWPWVKQRSRWLKGYAITYAVHMRRPGQLIKDLGLWRFFGVQVLFLGSLSQILLAPLLWSFWAFPLGLPHPLAEALSPAVIWTVGGIFLTCELLSIAISALAVRAAGKPGLMGWAPSLHFYFPMAALAAHKGLLELLWRPFYWDKTAHGIHVPPMPRHGAVTSTPPPQSPRHRAAGG